ncbi:hypothetical protein ACH3XW_4745 [Acanthocheilonema viteae]
MPLSGHWALRGGFTPRANPGRPNIHFPHPNICRQQHGEFFVSFYHCSQESVKMFDAMKQRIELAYEQRRKSEANRLQKITNGKVMQYLERIPLSKNVTLTIEIPNNEHAGMIERMEAWCEQDSIPKIMQDTGVLIQFPDLVQDVKNANDYVNRVTLTGPLANVEQARIRIRNFTPVAVRFPLETLKSGISVKDVKNIIDKAIAEKLIDFPNVEITVQLPQLPNNPIPLCVVRGAPSHERDICEACTALDRLLFDTIYDDEHKSGMIYSMVIDIPAVQQLAVTGILDGYLIRMISFETNAVIYFPTVADRQFGATVFYLYGSVNAIMKARKYIQGLLPVRLIFDVENDDLLCPVDASNREIFLRDTDHNVTIIVKKSPLEGEQLTKNDTLRNMVTIESEEYNLTNVYAMRHQLLQNGILKNEPLIVTKDFDFFKNDFKALIAKNNEIIAEGSNNSLAKASPLLYSQLNQNMQSNSFPSMRLISSTTINDTPASLPQTHIYQEELQPYRSENIPISVTVGSNPASQRKSKEGAVKFEDSIVTKVGYIQNIDKASVGQSFNEHSKEYNFDAVASNSNYDLTSNTASGNASESKCSCKKSSMYTRSFASESQSLMGSGTNVVDALINDQGSTTVAVAAAMLQNSPPQWFQSSGTIAALKSTEYFKQIPRIWGKKIISETFAGPTEFAENSMVSSPEKTWQIKKNLPLKSSFKNENYVREYHCDIGTDTPRDIPQRLPVRVVESKESSSDTGLSASFSNRNTNPLHSISCGNPVSNFNQNRLLHQNDDSTDDTYDYRTERQPARVHDTTVWENSRYSSSQLNHHYAHSNTREFFSARYRGRSSQNSSRSRDMIRGGRTMRQSMNHSDGYYSTFSRSESTWNLSLSGYNEDRRYNRRGITNMRFKRQFVNGAQLKEKGRGDRREEQYPSLRQEQQHSCFCNQFRKDRTKRIDVVVLVDEAQRSQNEQSSRSTQQTNRPALMMKELEKYTGNDKISSNSCVDMAKKGTTEDKEVQNKILVQDQSGSEQSLKVVVKERRKCFGDLYWLAGLNNSSSLRCLFL